MDVSLLAEMLFYFMAADPMKYLRYLMLLLTVCVVIDVCNLEVIITIT